MRFSVRFNNDLPVERYPELAERAEQAGFDAFWVSDDLFLRSAWVLLAAAARSTHRIQLGTCIVNPFTQHPAEIAMAAATLDELSDGRALLGISSGANDFLSWIGLRPERPVTAVAETIAALRRLFSGDRCHPSGRFVSGWTSEAYLRFRARQIPIYVGAMSPHMLELIGSAADGGLPLLLPPEHFAEVIRYVRKGASGAGRDPASIDLAACIWCSISSNHAAAERVLREKLAYYGHAFSPLILSRVGVDRAEFEPIRQAMMVDRDPERAMAMVTPAMLRLGVTGTADELIPRLEDLVALGATHLSFGPPLGPDPFEAIDVLANQVLSHFR
ncbi:MAG: LLM class flavin-dependent oxidoreductase [Chloroflexi bacterium]|nr:MAG: LLM class flavin-dependent oxidoreductase [Chloroflexota bacterium]